MINSLLNKIRTFQNNRRNAARAIAGKYIIMHGAQVYPDVKIGKYSYVAHNTIINAANIGNYTSIGPNCTIGFGDHPIGLFTLSPLVYKNSLFYTSAFRQHLDSDCNKPVIIGHDVWIGANVVIRNGVTIGNGAVIGAGSIVLKDVEPYTINYGVPSFKRRSRFSDEEITTLNKLQWWDLSIEELAERIKSDTAYKILDTYKQYKV